MATTRTRKKLQGAISIKDITKGLIKQLTSDKESNTEKARRAWKRAAGKRFNLHAEPTSFRRKRLIVKVDTSAWLYEMTMKKKGITSRLKRILKDDFNQLQFRIGKIER